MDKTTLETLKTKVTKGNELQNKLLLLKQLRQGLTDKKGLYIVIPCKECIKTIADTGCVQELFEPVKDAIIDIVNNQIMMFTLEFEEL